MDNAPSLRPFAPSGKLAGGRTTLHRWALETAVLARGSGPRGPHDRAHRGPERRVASLPYQRLGHGIHYGRPGDPGVPDRGHDRIALDQPARERARRGGAQILLYRLEGNVIEPGGTEVLLEASPVVEPEGHLIER